MVLIPLEPVRWRTGLDNLAEWAEFIPENKM